MKKKSKEPSMIYVFICKRSFDCDGRYFKNGDTYCIKSTSEFYDIFVDHKDHFQLTETRAPIKYKKVQTKRIVVADAYPMGSTYEDFLTV